MASTAHHTTYSVNDRQLSLFGYNRDHAATSSPRELWLKLDRSNISDFVEDRRLERKTGSRIHFDALAEYVSMWSNTVDGGIILIGIEDDGKITGCAKIGHDQLNRLDSFHTQFCPEATPESRRIPVTVDSKPDFVPPKFQRDPKAHYTITKRKDARHELLE